MRRLVRLCCKMSIVESLPAPHSALLRGHQAQLRQYSVHIPCVHTVHVSIYLSHAADDTDKRVALLYVEQACMPTPRCIICGTCMQALIS